MRQEIGDMLRLLEMQFQNARREFISEAFMKRIKGNNNGLTAKIQEALKKAEQMTNTSL